MSRSERQIVCRGCGEEVPANDNCPYCGESTRNDRTLYAAMAVGLVILGASLLDISGLIFFAAIGLVITAMAGYMLYDKRKRIDEATADEEDLFDNSEETA